MTGGNSLSRASGSVPLASLKRSMTSVDNSDEEDVNVLPENLENMKTGFLQYRRMQLKSQVVSGDPKDKGGLEQELAEVERLEAERKQVRDELEQKKKALEEREKQYFADGVALANGFLEVARNVHELGKGALETSFETCSRNTPRLSVWMMARAVTMKLSRFALRPQKWKRWPACALVSAWSAV